MTDTFGRKVTSRSKLEDVRAARQTAIPGAYGAVARASRAGRPLRYHAGMALFGKSKVKLTDYAACAG